MTIFAPTPSPALDQAEQIRSDAEAAYELIRSNGDLTADAMRARLAAVYVDAQTRMDALRSQATDGYQADWQKALTAAFGTADLAATAADRASLSLSYRDAQDRADSITDPLEAERLLSRANDTGDELLARAIAQHAWEMGGPLGAGWGKVLDAFTATRPRAASAIANLVSLQSGGINAAGLFAWVLAKPSELAALPDYAIHALAAQ